MAQLPFLIYEQRPPMSSAAFKALAEALMTEEDAVLLEQIHIDPDPEGLGGVPSYAQAAPSTGCEFIDNWREWERSLRLNLAKSRAVKLKRDNISTLEPPFMPTEAVAAAHKALNSDISPLDGELLIDKARWNAIDVLAGNDYFDRNNVFAYLLKLLLLERRLSFNVERGFTEYKALYASIIESSQNSGHNSLGELK
jgi:hypothetical protein